MQNEREREREREREGERERERERERENYLDTRKTAFLIFIIIWIVPYIAAEYIIVFLQQSTQVVVRG